MRDRIDPSLLPGDEERALLRQSVRDLLAAHWPVDHAVEWGQQPGHVASIWQRLADLGLGHLCHEPENGGLSEIVVAMEELGRAACPAPMLGAALANLALTDAALLVDLQSGAARASIAFAGFDTGLGYLSARGDTLSAGLACVDGAMAATHLIVVANETPGLFLIDCGQTGVRIETARALGGGWLCNVELVSARAGFIALPLDTAEDLHRIARLCLLARAHGAARRSFELAVDYARERRQFGQPIGRFQAVQHKLANGLVALEGVRLTVANACRAFDRGEPDWRYFASAAIAFGGTALRQVSLETQHAFGAIGYAEEHEAPRHFRAVHLDTIMLGGAARARGELADHLLDRPDATIPEYDLGRDGNTFREEVRGWLKLHWSGARKVAFDAKPFQDREFDPSFARDLGMTGWLGLGWPREYGGQARTPLEQLAFIEVMERAEAPRIGAAVQANALMMFGSVAQKARYLPEILSGGAMHGMGYSEPEAGSDLASLRTRAVRDGDQWVINGQKIWTTTYWGKYMFLAARTDPDAKPQHAGISMFIIPMATPGITVNPAKTMYDGSFANIFYDDVRVPGDALLGPLHGGWKVLTDALANERGLVGGGIVLKVAHAFDLLCRDVREADAKGWDLVSDRLVRDRIGTLAADIEVGRQLMIHCAELAASGTTPPEMGAISKVFSGELMERFGEAALDILGPAAALSQDAPGNLRRGRYEQNLRHSLMWVISIGTNEIQRSLIAQRGLGLPR